MALDIAKQGRRPYQSLEKPRPQASSGVHIRRYFSNFFERTTSVLLLVSVFLVVVWVWDFGSVPGFGRSTLWAVVSGLILVAVAGYALFRSELSGDAWSRISRYSSLVRLVFLMVVIFGVSSLTHLGFAASLGLSAPASHLSFAGAVGGAVWLLGVLYVRNTVSAFKQLLVALFFGSTLLAGYIFFRLIFGGGYEAVSWVAPQGVLLLFGITSFLMLAFAMFQKRGIKLLWTGSIVLHLLVLFAWDFPSVWLMLIGGISALLLFQIITSKKLWQRNFTYPLQVWGIAVLMLLIPVKLFTGTSVPETSVLSFDLTRKVAAAEGLTFFGNGLGQAANMAAYSLPSFYDLSSGDFAPDQVGHGYFQLYLEVGLLGLLLWIALIVLHMLKGIRFLRANLEALKEGSMSESIYLGAIFLVGIAMLLAGIWFSVFSLLVYWLSMLLFAGSAVFWNVQAKAETEEKSRSRFSVPISLGRGLVFAILVGYIGFLIIGARMFSSHQKVFALARVGDARQQLDAWQKVVALNPWNPLYRLQAAQAQTALLATPISIDAQRENIEAVTKTLAKQTQKTTNPLIHWLAAEVYIDLETYAEGSSQLAREQYQKALLGWPKNVALPVAITKFYRENTDTLVSGTVSAAELRIEARENLERALSLTPDYLPARLELAFLLEDEEGIAAALAELEPWEDASAEIEYHIGRLYFNEGDFTKAAEKFSNVLALVPSHSNARYSLGVAYFRLEQFDDALTEFQEVLRLNPGNEDVQEKINQVQEQIGG